jgi:hypothetical protein
MTTAKSNSQPTKSDLGIAKLFRSIVGKLPRPNVSRVLRCESLEARQLFAADAFVGTYDSGNWHLSDNPAQRIYFGLAGDHPVMGDWDGDGRKTPGVYRNGTWVLDLTGNGFDSADRTLSFGLPGDKAVAGDWDGDGMDTVGVFRNGAWFFDRNGNGYDVADVDPVFFGWGSDTPVPGDWDGDGKDSPGIYRNGTWALDLTGNGFDPSDRFLQFGLPGDQPVSGDWNRDGKDSPGVLQKNRWYFDLEGDGYTGEVGQPNQFGNGKAVAGSSSIGPRPTQPRPILEIGAPPSSKPPVNGAPKPPGTPGHTPSPKPTPIPKPKPTPTPTPKPTPEPAPKPTPIASPEIEVVGITNGQATPISFGNVNIGENVVRSFTIRNTGNATLTLGRLQVPKGFSAVNGLPGTLAPKASTTIQIRMDTASPGQNAGTISFVTNDADESQFRFEIAGKVNYVATSNWGAVVASQTIVGSSGVMVLKTVRTHGASGNNLRLYADFLAHSGGSFRRDVLIGQPNNSFGDQVMPHAISIDAGRFVIAWRSTSLSNSSNIRYAIVDALGSVVGSAEQTANVGYAANQELRSLTSISGGFRITWFDGASNKLIRRDFNMVGAALTGELRG